MKPLFSTNRLELTRATSDDNEFFVGIFGDPKMTAHVGGPLPLSMIEKGFSICEEDWQTFGFGRGVIEIKATRERIGSCNLFHTKFDGEDVLEIGWWILPQFQRNGYASEAAEGYVRFARENVEPKIITAFPDEGNLPSNRICEKLGFTRVRPFSYEYFDRKLSSIYWRLSAHPG